MEGISEHHRREVGVNLTGGRTNAIEICEKILSAPTLDQLLVDFCAEENLDAINITADYIDKRVLEKRWVEEPVVVDDAVLED